MLNLLVFPRITKNGDFPVHKFEWQMKHLHNRGYTTLDSKEVCEHIENKTLPKEKKVALIFENIYLENLTLIKPILEKYNFRGIICATTEWIEESSKMAELRNATDNFINIKDNIKPILEKPQDIFCTWDEVKTLQTSFDIEANTHTRGITLGTKLQWHEELLISYKILRDRLNIDSKILLVPSKFSTVRYINTAVSVGFKVLIQDSYYKNKNKDKRVIKAIYVKQSEIKFAIKVACISMKRWFI